ncbi:glycosyltransferase [Marinimicrobium sp. C6131]|uniref:glycosyltransferase family 4 protein n=1 Tax=Marinimicrobium sp. C6131 TaxID=3022676 RepID=UPI00223CF403|nr:glycosyltransferase [Marinimicrobium sp. C6131]UZJ43458.1 glycosyltransferase [Marinimicrobium sp. C6131]
MILFLTINIRNKSDNTGMPEYYRRVLPLISEKESLVIIDVDNSCEVFGNIEELNYKGIPLISFGIPKGYDIGVDFDRLSGFISGVCDRFRVKVVVFPDYMFFPYLDFPYFRAKGITTVYFCHLLYRGVTNSFMCNLDIGMIDINPWVDCARVEQGAVMEADQIWANSEFTESEILKYYGSSLRSKIKVAPLGIDKEDWPYSPQNKNLKVGYLGRLDIQKGIQRILNDVDRNPDFYKNYPMQIAGQGALENEVIRRQFFDRTIQYYGPLEREEVKSFVRPLKWVVFPSIYEPWGLVVTECMAMGKICIIQDCESGMSEQITDEVNGFRVDMSKTSISQFISMKEDSGINFDEISTAARRDSRSLSEHTDILLTSCIKECL